MEEFEDGGIIDLDDSRVGVRREGSSCRVSGKGSVVWFGRARIS